MYLPSGLDDGLQYHPLQNALTFSEITDFGKSYVPLNSVITFLLFKSCGFNVPLAFILTLLK